MPYFDSNFGFGRSYLPWKSDCINDILWSPHKSEVQKKFSNPKDFEKKRVNDIKPLATNHRIDMFYSRPDKGYQSTTVARSSPAKTKEDEESGKPTIPSPPTNPTKKQLLAQHYNENAFLQKRQFHRSQEKPLTVDKILLQ